MRAGKRFTPTIKQCGQIDKALLRLKELQRDPAVWNAVLDEQRRLFIEGEQQAAKWGDPCEGTVFMLDPADIRTRDRPPHRYRSRTRSATSTPEAPPTDTTEPTDDGCPAGLALKQVLKQLHPEAKPPTRRRK